MQGFLAKSPALLVDRRIAVYRSLRPDVCGTFWLRDGTMRDRAAGDARAETAPSPTRSGELFEFKEADLTVADIMTEAIISAAPEETVVSATERMAAHNVSCIAVMDGRRAVGILTERDVVRGVAGGDDRFAAATVAERMSRPVISSSTRS